MGTLFYGSSEMQVDFDDRTLAHLQLVIGVKLRQHERFYFSWTDHSDSGSGRSVLWMETSIPMLFRYASARPLPINRGWLRLLTASADQPTGLLCLAEPGVLFDRTMLPHSRV